MTKTVIVWVLLYSIGLGWTLIFLNDKIKVLERKVEEAAKCVEKPMPASSEVEFRKAQRIIWVKTCK